MFDLRGLHGRRRLAAFSATSTSGITTAAVRFSIHALPCSALYIKLWGEQCLTHVGREGREVCLNV